jgi:hypothetical protein
MLKQEEIYEVGEGFGSMSSSSKSKLFMRYYDV